MDELKQMSKNFHIDGLKGMARIHDLEKQALAGGIGKASKGKPNETLATDGKSINTLWRASDKGCETCNHTGYKGRVGIYEVLGNSSEVQKSIVGNATSDTIQSEAISGGMIMMQIDGFIKALRGQTSIEEILRVTSVD